jgi:hypothetical protein
MYWNYRRTSVVVCPETRKPEAVRVNAKRAALDTLKGAEVKLRFEQCSRWPEQQNCGQVCVSQIENDPELCHASAMAQQWFLDRSCVYCGRSIEKLHWHDHPPALLDIDHQTMIGIRSPTSICRRHSRSARRSAGAAILRSRSAARIPSWLRTVRGGVVRWANTSAKIRSRMNHRPAFCIRLGLH